MRYIIMFCLSFSSLVLGQAFYPTPAGYDTSKYLMPGDLIYQGAFKLPSDLAGSPEGFAYTAGAMTYSPKGDSAGPSDGYPGALTIAGHTYAHMTAQINIPVPVISKNYSLLATATVLIPFKNFGIMPPNPGSRIMALEEIKDSLYVQMGDAYLPAAYGGQKMMAWGTRNLTRFGAMRPITGDRVDCFGDYLFEIPKSWSDKYAPGRFIASGRHRWGDLCGQGPAIFAMNPLGDSPDTTTALTTTRMLRYRIRDTVPNGPISSYSHGGDYYDAGAFLESGSKSTIILTGHKGLSSGSYGDYCGYQGFHDTAGYAPYIIFYNPDDLGKVATNQMDAHLPQPYAGMNINSQMMVPNIKSAPANCSNRYLAALAYDRTRNILYGLEDYQAEGVVHVWKVKAYAAMPPPPPPLDTTCKKDTIRITTFVPVHDTTRITTVVQIHDTTVVIKTIHDTIIVQDTTFLGPKLNIGERGYLRALKTKHGIYQLIDILGPAPTLFKDN